MTDCPDCTQSWPDEMLVCRSCGTLLWREQLGHLFAAATEAENKQDWHAAMVALSECCRLLPPETRQYETVRQRMLYVGHMQRHAMPSLSPESLEAPPARCEKPLPMPRMIADGSAAMVKGLTRPQTIISMLIFTACLAWLVGWREALIFCLFIYIHEMGHILAIPHFGLRFGWPVFIPFLGAFVLQGRKPDYRYQNIVISIAGPIAGFLAGAMFYGILLGFPKVEMLERIAYVNLLVNFLNLLPFWILDGARIAEQLRRPQLLALGSTLALFSLVDRNGFALLMGAAWLVRAAVTWQSKARTRREDASDQKLILPLTVLLLLILLGAGFCLRVLKV